MKILECKETRGQRVLPIFNNVDPADVRKQGKIWKSLSKTCRKYGEYGEGENMERVKIWRDALT